MTTSPDFFLSQNGISQFHLPSSNPAEIVKCLQELNNTRHLDDKGAIVYNQYETPNFMASPISSASVSPQNVKNEEKATEHYFAALKTGDLAKVHAALDAWNAAAMASGGQEPKMCPLDFDILAEGDSLTAQFARTIISLRVALDELDVEGTDWDAIRNNGTNEFPAHNVCHVDLFGGEVRRDADGDVVGWFDTPEAYKALKAYEG